MVAHLPQQVPCLVDLARLAGLPDEIDQGARCQQVVADALGLVDSGPQEGRTLVGGGRFDHQYRALFHHRRDADTLVTVGGGEGIRLVGPVARLEDLVAEHVRLGHEGHRLRSLLVAGQLVDRVDEQLRARVHFVEVAGVVGDSQAQAQCRRLLADVAGGARVPEPQVTVHCRVVEQTCQPRRLRGHAAQPEIVLGLGQPGLGQLQRLVGGSEPERLLCTEPSLGNHLVVAFRPLRVQRHGHVVAAVRTLEHVERGLVEAAAFPAEEGAPDRLPRQIVMKAESVGVGLDQQTAVDGGTQERDQLVLLGAGDGGQHVETDPPAEDRRRSDDPAHCGVEFVELRPHELGDGPRQRSRRQRVGGHVAGTGYELLEEEWVAARAAMEGIHGPERRIRAEHGGEESAHIGRGEAIEAHVGDRMATLEPRRGDPPRDDAATVRPDGRCRRPGADRHRARPGARTTSGSPSRPSGDPRTRRDSCSRR